MRSRAGQRRERVRIERLGAASAGYVNGSETWSNLFECSADINPIMSRNGGETEIGDRLVDVSGFEIRLRYAAEIADLSTRDRIICIQTGETYNIRNVIDPDNRKRDLLIHADTGKPKG